MANDPIHQFQINTIVPIEIANIDLSFTNSSLFMIATTAAVCAFLVLSTTGRGLVPGRWQAAAEMSYEFIASMLRDAAGTQGMKEKGKSLEIERTSNANKMSWKGSSNK